MATSRRARAVLAGCWVIAVGYNAYLIAPASVAPRLAASFDGDAATAGLAIGAVYAAWVLVQVPAGAAMDRRDNRRLVLAGVAVYLVAAVAGFAAESAPGFLTSRFLGGTAAAFVWTANANVVGRTFPAPRRAFATSLFVASAPAGFALAQFAGPLIAATAGWRATLLVYPLVTLVGVPVFLLAADDPVTSGADLSAAAFVETLRRPSVLAISGSSFCAYSLFLFFNSWMPTYATERLALDLAAAGAATALVPLSGILARPGGGWLADRAGRRPVVAAALVLSVPALGGLLLVRSPGAFAALLLSAGFVSQLGIGVYYVYVAEVVGEVGRGTGLAVLTTASVAGSLVSPVVTGWLITAVSWPAAFAYAAALGLLGAGLVALAPRAATTGA
ncbi:MAG: nitrate/nitrite transporter [Haloferacaceae archaeon]